MQMARLFLLLLPCLSAVDDVMWGAFVARTRATSTGDAVTLRPMHDMLNHAEHPNASCCETDNGYATPASLDQLSHLVGDP